MSDVSREELISAYLDDELSSDERARVETWLAESPQLRQFHDELVALRSGVKALPRHQAPGDLAPLVLKQLEQTSRRANDKTPPPRGSTARLALDKQIADASAANDATQSGGLALPGSLWRQRGVNLRRVIWPIVAVAAALIVLVYDARQRPADQEIAQAPEPSYEAPAVVPAELSAPEDPSFAAPAADSAAPRMAKGYAPHESGEGYDQPDGKQEYMTRSARPPTVPPAPAARSAETRLDAAFNSADAAPQAAGAVPRAMTAPANAAAASEQPLQTVVVTQRYFQNNDFEKLLKSQKIDWQRMPVPPADAVAQSTASQAARAGQANQMHFGPNNQSLFACYQLNASEDVVDQVLSQVPPPAGSPSNGLFVRQQQALPKGNQQPEGVQVLLVAPADPTAAPGGAKK